MTIDSFESSDSFHVGSDGTAVMTEVVDPHYRQEPLYLCDEARLREQVALLKRGFPGEVAYAVKANPKERILRVIAEVGIGCFDVASLAEMEVVRRIQPEARLLFNNPVKTPFEIETAARELGVRHFTVQTQAEVEKVLEHSAVLAPEQLEMVVRLKPPLNPQALVDFHESFGAEEEEVVRLVRMLRRERVGRLGISVHTGSQNADVESYRQAITLMAEIARRVQGLSILNIGGGLPANYFGMPPVDVAALLEAIHDSLRREVGDLGIEEVLMEPGRAMVAESTALATPVVEASKGTLRIRDGVFGSYHAAQLHGFFPHCRAFREQVGELVELPQAPTTEYTVYGRTCDAADRLQMVAPADLHTGDILFTPSAGAYTSAAETRFNGFPSVPWVFYDSAARVPVPEPSRAERLSGQSDQPGLEIFRAAEINPALLDEISGFYRFIFANAYGGHYLVYPSSGKCLTPQEVFNTPSKRPVDLATLDGLRRFPLDSQTGERAVFYRKAQVLAANFREKFAQDSSVALLRDAAGDLVGLSFGYPATLREAFELEDWRNPLLYAGVEVAAHCRDIEECLQKLNTFRKAGGESELTAESRVFCYNCVALAPQAGGISNFLRLVRGLFESLPEEYLDLPMISEAQVGSASYRIFRSCGVSPVPGVFGTELTAGEAAFGIGNMRTLLRSVQLPPRDFRRLIGRRTKD